MEKAKIHQSKCFRLRLKGQTLARIDPSKMVEVGNCAAKNHEAGKAGSKEKLTKNNVLHFYLWACS